MGPLAWPWQSDRGARWRRRLRYVGLLVLVLGLLSAFSDRGILRLYRLVRVRAELRGEIARLKASNERLTEEARALREDPIRIEAIAREDLGLVRPGDVVYEFRGAREGEESSRRGP